MPMSRIQKEKVLYPELSYQLCGLCFGVHNTLGMFRSEKSYGDLLEYSLQSAHIPFVREYEIPPSFVGENEGRNKVDFLIADSVVLELKAIPFVGKKEYYQMQRYLQASKKKLGIIVNFRQRYLRPKRVVCSY